MQVIGDNKAAKASLIFLQRTGRDSLRKLEEELGVQVKFIHVIRNPFDNIATMALRLAELKKNKAQAKLSLKIFREHFKCRAYSCYVPEQELTFMS